MLKKRDRLICEQDQLLAGYAVPHQESGQRIYPEPEHAFRLPLQRDRDRLFHCRSFKRLEYKTQVFINTEGDNFRTRLTHTLEVAGASRTIATILGLNPYLAEVIALAHDIGHAPFGHAGQEILAHLMQEHGGFEHNKQSLRVVTILENRYSKFSGLNLCLVTLTGLMKHGASYQNGEISGLRKQQGPSLEALICDLADEITYNTHDIEDGLEKGYLHEEELLEVAIWQRHYQKCQQQNHRGQSVLLLRACIRSIMNTMITSLVAEIDKNLRQNQIETRQDLILSLKKDNKLVQYEAKMQEEVRQLKNFLRTKLYFHPKVKEMSIRGQAVIEFLFHYYQQHPHRIPNSYLSRQKQDGIYRVICDYIAGMTDRYAILQYEELYS